LIFIYDEKKTELSEWVVHQCFDKKNSVIINNKLIWVELKLN